MISRVRYVVWDTKRSPFTETSLNPSVTPCSPSSGMEPLLYWSPPTSPLAASMSRTSSSSSISIIPTLRRTISTGLVSYHSQWYGKSIGLFDFMNIKVVLWIPGRTGRCQQSGTAYTYFTSGDGRQARGLVAVLRETGQNPPSKLSDMARNNNNSTGNQNIILVYYLSFDRKFKPALHINPWMGLK